MMNNEQDISIYNMLGFKPRKGDLKKMEIIESAIECLATIGFEKTTYEAIAKKIDTRRAHVAYHFSDKNEILKACVSYINSSYLIKSRELVAESEEGLNRLEAFIRAPFIWGTEHPHQLTVMLLFYYLCSFNEEYKELHNQIRQNGVDRIFGILSKEICTQQTAEENMSTAKLIQNLLSGAIMDSATTNKPLKLAMEETVKQIITIVNNKRKGQ